MAETARYCLLCGRNLYDDSGIAVGSCVRCGRIMCEECFDYDEDTTEVTCPGRCRCACVSWSAHELAVYQGFGDCPPRSTKEG